MFFKTYSEKLWGMKCREPDDDFAKQRIKKLSMLSVITAALSGGGGSKHKTLVDEFAYPLGGTGAIYRRMAEAVVQHGGTIVCNHAIKGLVVENGVAKGLTHADGSVEQFDEIISTMPFTEAVRSMAALPEDIAHKLDRFRYRNTIMVYLHVEGADLFADNWLYVHSPELQMGRITNFRNWAPELYGNSPNTILALEYWCYADEPMWRENDEALIALASQEMQKTGLLHGHRILDGYVYRIDKSYPTYHRGYKADLQPVEQYVQGIAHLHCIGRYGAFKYNNQDHSLLMGLLAAENINNNAGHNLWDVNTDYDTYQESSLITETGLAKK